MEESERTYWVEANVTLADGTEEGHGLNGLHALAWMLEKMLAKGTEFQRIEIEDVDTRAHLYTLESVHDVVDCINDIYARSPRVPGIRYSLDPKQLAAKARGEAVEIEWKPEFTAEEEER